MAHGDEVPAVLLGVELSPAELVPLRRTLRRLLLVLVDLSEVPQALEHFVGDGLLAEVVDGVLLSRVVYGRLLGARTGYCG